MNLGIILQLALQVFKIFANWSAKKNKREQRLFELVKGIDEQIIHDMRFRQQYRDIVVDQIRLIDKLNAEEQDK